MTPEQTNRLSQLAEPWCPKQLIVDLWDLDLDERRLATGLSAWAARHYKGTALRNPGTGLQVQRHILESYLLQNDLTSWKLAAVYLGMDREQLKETVEALEARGTYPQIASEISVEVVRRRDAERLFRSFQKLQHKIFSSHTSMCRALHAAIGDELGIAVEPVYCVTSVALGESDTEVAAAIDGISLDPVGLRYQVWLETKKPAHLAPDVCSLKLYARNESALKAWVMRGSEPEGIDEKLRAA